MRIAVGVAKGLIYVHQVLKVIHRDVKTGNILLDENFEPKLTDFGLATKIIENEDGVEQESHISELKGTPGFVAPEAVQYGLVSTKFDVYSYGVLLFVLFSGRKPMDRRKSDGRQKNLTEWFSGIWDRFYEPVLVDLALGDKYSVEGLKKIYEIARNCTTSDQHARPDMFEVEMKVREAAAFPVQVVPRLTRRHSI